jgi:hypothetical protein
MYILLLDDFNLEINEETYNINNYNTTVKWIKNTELNYYYHEEKMFSKEMIRKHTILLIKHLEEIYNKKIKYLLTKKVVEERADPDAGGYWNGVEFV